MKVLLEANVELENQTQTTLANVKGRLKGEVVTYEIQMGVSAAKDDDTSGEQKAIQAASAVGGQAPRTK